MCILKDWLVNRISTSTAPIFDSVNNLYAWLYLRWLCWCPSLAMQVMISQQSESQDMPSNDGKYTVKLNSLCVFKSSWFTHLFAFLSVVMKERRVRGKSRGKHLAILLKATPAKKLPIIIPRDAGVPVGEHAAKFSSELSFAVKNTAPLNVRKWLEVSAEVKNNIYKNMQVTNFVDEHLSLICL